MFQFRHILYFICYIFIYVFFVNFLFYKNTNKSIIIRLHVHLYNIQCTVDQDSLFVGYQFRGFRGYKETTKLGPLKIKCLIKDIFHIHVGLYTNFDKIPKFSINEHEVFLDTRKLVTTKINGTTVMTVSKIPKIWFTNEDCGQVLYWPRIFSGEDFC